MLPLFSLPINWMDSSNELGWTSLSFWKSDGGFERHPQTNAVYLSNVASAIILVIMIWWIVWGHHCKLNKLIVLFAAGSGWGVINFKGVAFTSLCLRLRIWSRAFVSILAPPCSLLLAHWVHLIIENDTAEFHCRKGRTKWVHGLDTKHKSRSLVYSNAIFGKHLLYFCMRL